MFGIAGIIISLYKWTLSSVFVLIGRGRFRLMLIGSVVMVQIGHLCGQIIFTAGLGYISVCIESFHSYWSLSCCEGRACVCVCVEIQMAFRNNLCNWLWMPRLYAVHVGSVQQQYPSLQGVGVELHHVRLCLPLAVLCLSPLYPCDSTPCFLCRKRVSHRH